MIVCRHCFGNSPTLIHRINKLGVIGTCETCRSKKAKVVEAHLLSDLFDGLKDYYKPLIGHPYVLGKEGIYGIGDKTGDDTLEQVLRDDWEVFSERIDDDQASEILSDVWPDYAGEYMEHPFDKERNVRRQWSDLKFSLMHEWRFFHKGKTVDHILTEFFNPWVEYLSTRLYDKTWFRARIQKPQEDFYENDQMLAPPPRLASANRANPAGIPHLYLAIDEKTAVTEVRACPQQIVRIAEIQLPEKLDILDLAHFQKIIDPFAIQDIEHALLVRSFLSIFASEMSQPTSPEDKEIDYICTQFLSEYFRDRNLDGIIYPSTVSEGVNAVIFNPSIVTLLSPCYNYKWT